MDKASEPESAAAALGRLGGKKKTKAQQAARRRNAAKAIKARWKGKK